MGMPTCDDLLKIFSEFLVSEKGYSKSTYRCYRQDLTEFIGIAADQCMRLGISLSHPASIRPDQIDALVIRGYLTVLHKKKNKKSTIARKLSTLKSFYKLLMIRGYCKTNPV